MCTSIFGKSDYDTMLQIVPSADFSPPSSSEYSCDYAVDDFDLPLLPGTMESTKPFVSGSGSGIHQLLSLYCDSNPSSSVFPSLDSYMTKDPASAMFYSSYDTFTKKTEACMFDRNGSWNSGCKNIRDNLVARATPKEDHIMASKNSFLDMDLNDWDCRNDWDDMRMQASVPSVISCSSSCASPDFQLPPATPPDFQRILTLDEVKPEVTLNLQNLLDEKATGSGTSGAKSELLRSILEKSPVNGAGSNDAGKAEGANNHTLLREVLKDTSFQRKYNLRPFDIEGLGTGFQMEAKEKLEKGSLKDVECDVNFTEGHIAPVLSKAIEQLMQDVDNTSVMLGIPRDPKKWSVEDVRSWLLWNSRQHNLPISIDLFNISGATLTSMNEQDFQQRAPQCGGLLYAQLEIWKVNSIEDTHLDVNNLLCDVNTAQSTSSIEISDEDDDEDEEMADISPSCSPAVPAKAPTGGRGSGSHIHLWQFLKELLSSPQSHGSCIRWLDRQKGVFKIEDSVRVARLWGKRKNRPAMNYDKLSRSIRQYYKKGIMKKTERSQRLVYQFCSPYSL